MSEVTASTEEPIVSAGQRLMRYRQPTSTLPHRMLWLTILAGTMVLAVGEGTANEFNGTASESPVELTTTEAPPLREPVTDLFTAPISAFKVQVPLSPQLAEGEEAEIAGLSLGKAENNTESSATPPFSNLWFNAGQSLGSAANSLTGWLNSRLVPQTTSTTTKPPEVIVRVQSNQGNRKPLISIDGNRKSQANRITPVVDDTDEDDDDDDDDADDEEEYDDAEEEQVDEEDSNSNRYSSNNDEDDDYANDDEDDEEEEPVKKRKKQKRVGNNRRGYDYEEEEEEEDDDAEDYDDDEDSEYDRPTKNSGRQQQQESFLNRFRQLAQMPYSSSNKEQNSVNQANNPGYRPVRIIQNGQVIQLVQDRPTQQVKRRRRPSSGQSTFQLVPIRNQQVPNSGQKQKRKKFSQPDPTNQIVIPIPQSSQNGQQRPSQYITIPWSQLGIPAPQQDYAQSGQQAAPIIVNIPQHALKQNPNRRKRPVQKPSQTASTPQRKRLRRPLKRRPQSSQFVSLLTDQSIRDIFRVPEIPPSRTPQEDTLLGGKRKRPVKTNEMQSDNGTTIMPESELEEDDDESQDEQQPYIVVGDDDTADEALPRHVMPKRYLHIGGMKPYVDVLNKGRFYLKSGRQLKMDFDERPESKITSINAERAVAAEKAVLDITTESSSETKANAPPTIVHLESQDSSTTGNPLPQ